MNHTRRLVRWVMLLSLMLAGGGLTAPTLAQQADQPSPPGGAAPGLPAADESSSNPDEASAPLPIPQDAALSPRQRQAAEQARSLMTELIARLGHAQPVTRRWLAERLHQLHRHDGLHIEQVKLCKRVQGFGVYEPFAQPEFPADQENPLIVYVELDQFRAVPHDQHQYQVRLTSDISLIDPATGLAVWRQPTETITDTSRNRRLDFFMVQLIRLPATLAPGRYHLRIRVTDLSNDSVAQVVTEIRITSPQSAR